MGGGISGISGAKEISMFISEKNNLGGSIMKRKVALFLVVCLCLTMVLSGCNKGQQESKDTNENVKLRVAIASGLWGGYFGGIEKAQGFFKEEGLDIEWIRIDAGPSVVAALMSGDIQFGFTGPGGHTSCADNSVHVISLTQIGNADALVVSKESGIKSLKDLEGKKIATQLGTAGEILLDLICEANNIDKDKLQIINMDMTGAVTAFVSGHVDAVATWGQHVTMIHEKMGDDAIELVRVGEYRDRLAILGSIIATPKYIEENEDIVLKFVKALNKCYDFRYEHFDETIKATADFLDVDPEVLKKDSDNGLNLSAKMLKEYYDDGTYIQFYRNQLKYFQETGKVTATDVKPEDYVRMDIIGKAFDEHFKNK